MTTAPVHRYLSLEEFRALIEPYEHAAYLSDDREPFNILVQHSMAAVPYYSHTHFLQYARILTDCAIAKGVDSDYVVHQISELNRNIVLQGDYTNRIANCIEQILHNDRNPDKLCILPLICGAGKSTAISYLIKRVLEKPDHDGILIVTDRKDRMDEYVSPARERDPELYDYLQAQDDRIAILKMGANLPAMFSKAKHSPVVILTTQRYFSMDKENIKDILTWGQGKHRSLILFDESPILTERISITRQLLNEIATMLSERIPYHIDTQAEKQFCIQYWEKFRHDIYEAICSHEDLLDDPEYFSPYRFDKSELDEDDQRFLRFIESNKDYLRLGGNIDEDNDPRVNMSDYSKIIKNIFRLFSHTCIRYTAHSGAWYKSTISAVVDNRDKMTRLGAKVIILDGTGTVNPDYNPSTDQIQNARKYDRELDNLTIHFINTPKVNKDDMNSSDYAKYVGKAAAKYIAENHSDMPCAAFTYKTAEKAIADSFPDVEHFGNLKGKNTFRNYQVLAQIGLHRFDNEFYIAQTLYHHPELLDRLEPNAAPAEISMWCDLVKTSCEYAAIVENFMLVDLEQNIFRSKIRMPDCVDPIHYYVFCNTTACRSLINATRERFCTSGSKVVEVDDPAMMTGIIDNQRPKVESTIEARMLAWIDSLTPGELFTTKKNVNKNTDARIMLFELNLEQRQYERVRERSPAFKKLLQSMSTERKGYYRR